jgi:hypothetical protein
VRVTHLVDGGVDACCLVHGPWAPPHDGCQSLWVCHNQCILRGIGMPHNNAGVELGCARLRKEVFYPRASCRESKPYVAAPCQHQRATTPCVEFGCDTGWHYMADVAFPPSWQACRCVQDLGGIH